MNVQALYPDSLWSPGWTGNGQEDLLWVFQFLHTVWPREIINLCQCERSLVSCQFFYSNLCTRKTVETVATCKPISLHTTWKSQSQPTNEIQQEKKLSCEQERNKWMPLLILFYSWKKIEHFAHKDWQKNWWLTIQCTVIMFLKIRPSNKYLYSYLSREVVPFFELLPSIRKHSIVDDL